MGAWVNVAKDDTKPLFLDPDAITAVDYDPAEDILSFYTDKGLLLNIGAKAWNVDFEGAVRTLQDNGARLVPFPTRWPAEKGTYAEFPGYIAARAVTYATITGTDDKGILGAIVGVKGVGRKESYSTSQGEFDALLAAVRAEKTLLHFTPEVAQSRWHKAGGLYIDPKAVKQIQDGGAHRLDIKFEASSPLDINTKKFEVNDFVNDLPRPPGPLDLHAIFAEANRLKEQWENEARQAFAKEIADAHGDLTSIPVPDSFHYMRPEDIATIRFYEEKQYGHVYMNIQMPLKGGQQYPDSVSLYFKTKADRQNAFDFLQGVAAKNGSRTPSQPLPKPAPT